MDCGLGESMGKQMVEWTVRDAVCFLRCLLAIKTPLTRLCFAGRVHVVCSATVSFAPLVSVRTGPQASLAVSHRIDDGETGAC